MPITVRKIHPLFGAEVSGVDIREPVSAREFGEIRAAFEEHSVLVFRDMPMDDERQIRFSEMFGPLEIAGKANPGVGTPFARQSNLDIKTGTVIPPEDRRMIYQLANYFWHSDSSFKHIPSLCSMLTARIVPPEGGDTEFCSMRAAYDSLSAEMKAKIEPLVVEHSLIHSRGLVDASVLTDEMRAELPGALQRMWRINPINGRKALYLGAHASHVVGWPIEEGRALLNELTATALKPEFCFAHKWREGDSVLWDNRAVVHRATKYDTIKHKRLMQRTTIAGDQPTVPQ